MPWVKRPYSSGGSEIKHGSIFDTSDAAHLKAVREKMRQEKEQEAPRSARPSRPLPDPLTPGTPCLGLRIDVDTHEGMRDGVPKLLDLLGKAGVKGTFYLAFGPDKSGRAIINVLTRPGFLRKMLRSGAPKIYSLRTMLSGTLLPSRRVALAFPEVARRIVAEGHEAGVHAWDHRAWQDRLLSFSPDRVVLELERGADAFAEVFSAKPLTYASPAWFCCDESLRHQEKLGLLYGSDCRGTDPFLPVLDAHPLGTPQVPATLPTLDEALGEADQTAGAFFDRMLGEIRPGEWPVLTIHAELEGGPFAPEFAAFLEKAAARGIAVVPLARLLSTRLATGQPLPQCTMSYGAVEGRHGVVSLQMFEV